MKVIIALTILVFSSISFSDSIYVRKSTTNEGVTAAEGDKARDILRNVVTAQGHKLATTPGQAQWILKATINKAPTGPYIVKVDRFHDGKLVGAHHGSDASFDQAMKLATASLGDAIKALPEKTAATTTETNVHNDMPVAADGNREVATNPDIPAAAVEAKHPNYIKNWIVAAGPALSNGLTQGSSNPGGTKFAISLAYNLGLSEHFDLHFMYDFSSNTVAIGSVDVAEMAVGLKWYFFDRLTDFSPWIMVDLGYGGGNRVQDATGMGGGSIGVDIFRTQAATYFLYVRNSTMYTASGQSLNNWPNYTQLMIGINF